MMNNTPILSVIIPVFNQQELVLRALDSIPARNDIEIIVIDDCSTDNTWDNLTTYVEHSPKNIVLLYNDTNMGVGYTVNRGYDNAQGEYVVLLGSDDYFTQDFPKLLNELDGTDLIFFNLRINDGTIWKLIKETCDLYCGSVKIMRREFIGTTRCPIIRSKEDFYFWQQLKEKNPTMKFTDITAKHYNFPREHSLVWEASRTV